MVFTGNPGTGKTTVARLLSQIYYHLGLLKRPDVFVECVRADLVGRYQGETAIKVKNVVKSALGGIRVVDTTGAGDIFGGSAVSRILRLGKDPGMLTEEELRGVVRFACTAAGLSTTRPGGISSVPELAEVLERMAR